MLPINWPAKTESHTSTGTVIWLFFFMVTACAMSPYDKSDVEELINGSNPPVYHQYTVFERSMHYAAVGDPQKPLIVFIHGTPGSWEAFAKYLADEQLIQRAYLISVDRAGFGKSGYKQVILSLQQQAALLVPAIRQNQVQGGTILIGHSLGAPVAVRLAMDHPDLVSGMILIAPSLDPELEQPRWYNRMASSTLINWAIPTQLQLANREVMVLANELRLMLPLWDSLDIPVVVIQGDEDELVDPANADFAARMLGPRAKIIPVPEMGHFILWDQPDMIRDEIMALHKRVVP